RPSGPAPGQPPTGGGPHPGISRQRMSPASAEGRSVPSRIAFSTLAFPDATLAAAASAGRRWGYSGIELRLIDGELIDPAMPAADRAQVRRTLAAAGLPVVAVDSSIRLTGDAPGPDLRRFLRLASDWEAPLVRVFGGALDPPPARRDRLRAPARALDAA